MNRRKIVELDLNYNYVATYASQTECANKKGIHQSQVSQYLSEKHKPRNYILLYEDIYEALYKDKVDNCVEAKEETKDIVKPKSSEYYINVLVGLANGTLIDGASYDVEGTTFVYNKDRKALMVGNNPMVTYENMWRNVNIELPLLTTEERNFLNNLFKAFSNIEGIKKMPDRREGFEFISIFTKSAEEDITLPSFKEGKYYANLKQDVMYSLEDLDLEAK